MEPGPLSRDTWRIAPPPDLLETDEIVPSKFPLVQNHCRVERMLRRPREALAHDRRELQLSPSPMPECHADGPPIATEWARVVGYPTDSVRLGKRRRKDRSERARHSGHGKHLMRPLGNAHNPASVKSGSRHKANPSKASLQAPFCVSCREAVKSHRRGAYHAAGQDHRRPCAYC